MRKTKITGIKKAIGQFNSWHNQDRRYCANIMLDMSTGEVWTDCFIDRSSWIEYHDSNIISLSRYIRERTDEKFTMQLLREYAEMAINQ